MLKPIQHTCLKGSFSYELQAPCRSIHPEGLFASLVLSMFADAPNVMLIEKKFAIMCLLMRTPKNPKGKTQRNTQTLKP